jgi:hypothetical protein
MPWYAVNVVCLPGPNGKEEVIAQIVSKAASEFTRRRADPIILIMKFSTRSWYDDLILDW